jgi:adenosine kinase
MIARAGITYLEGYLWDPKDAKEAFVKAAQAAHAANRRVALTLSDAFCVDRYRDEFLDLMRKGTVDIMFANEGELKSLYQTADFHAAVGQLRNDCRFAVVTRSEHGCVVVTAASVLPVPAFPIDKLVDTTGAGDLFAAGFLVGLTHGSDHTTCGKYAALAAAEVIQHVGARPQQSLKALAAANGLRA